MKDGETVGWSDMYGNEEENGVIDNVDCTCRGCESSILTYIYMSP